MKLEHLPASLQAIAELIGLPATLTLVKKFGGTRIYVPETIPDGHWLERLIGRTASEILARSYGGHEHFDLPRATLATRRARDACLVDDYLQNISCRNLALKYEITERAVRKIIARAGVTEDDRQVELF